MSTSKHDEDAPITPPDNSTAVLLLRDIGDSTWRMFIPTIGATLIGLWVDESIGSKPWGMIAGIILGFVIAGLLIRSQLKDLSKNT